MSGTTFPVYPERGVDRDKWIAMQRPQRNAVDPSIPYAFLVEDERTADGILVPVATIFLTNRECPWRCLMCDLWRNTLLERVPVRSIPKQIVHALENLPEARQVKLYNSGSFFDGGAIPVEDYAEIACLLSTFDRVIVESHPALVNDRAIQFRDLLDGQLEVAMGLETVHVESLARLNKQMTLTQFSAAATFLKSHAIDLRAFVLVQPPFIPFEESQHWAERSIDFAFDQGATAVSVIPTRAGNGAMDVLQRSGAFRPPQLKTVEAAMDYGLGCGRGRVFVDLWDIDKVTACTVCAPARIERLAKMNLTQLVHAHLDCEACTGED